MKLKLELEVSRIGYVLYRNGMNPVLTATAEAEEDVKNVEFTLKSEPPFVTAPPFKADGIAAGTKIDLRDHLKVSLDPSLLISAADTTPCRIMLEASTEEETPVSEFCDTEVLPFEFWPGFEYPDLVASFVTPNAECLAEIRSEASDILKEWKMSQSLEGYQGDRNRVSAMAAAVYVAIQRLQINYVVPPAGFETSGQRIRLSDTVTSSKEGTCIDMSVLFCSVLESIGINTFIFLAKGHAFAGFWLVDEHMADTVSVDSSAITRLIRNRDACAVECTLMCTPGKESFDDACKKGLERLEDTDSFICAVDIRKARNTIAPLPTRRFENGVWVADRDEDDRRVAAPKSIGEVYEEVEERPLTRVDMWKRDLLDTSTRNPLVNMKVGAKAVPLLVSDTALFEDIFFNGSQFLIMSKPQDWDGAKIYAERPFETEAYVGNYAKSCVDEINRGWIRTPLTDGETLSSIKSIYRLYRKEMEESGCNSLFVTVGVLRWFESKGDKIPRYSPLILIPAELVKKQKGYAVVKYDEEAVFNVTLAEKLRQEYDIMISGIDPLPLDDTGVNVDRVSQNVRRCIEGMEGWEVLDGAALGVFSFSQYAMWKDLDKNIERLKENAVVNALVTGGIYHADPEISVDADPYQLCLCVAADGSQIKAVRASGEGKTFVMHGPPGTGKSQTITNIISNAMYQGKTVLFVAEKRAALEVVQKRMDKIGVGNHCLELHSDKTEKTKVLEQLKKAMDPVKECDTAKLDETLAKLEGMRAKLDSYVSSLHEKRAWGFSAYDCISRYEAYDVEGAKDLKVSPDTAMRMRPETIGNLEDDILKAHQAYSIARSMCDTGALESIHVEFPTASLQYDIEESMDEALAAADEVEALGAKMEGLGLPKDAEAADRIINAVLSADQEMAADPKLDTIPNVLPRAIELMDEVFPVVSSWDAREVRLDQATRMLKQSEELEQILGTVMDAGWLPQSCASQAVAREVSGFCSKILSLRPAMDKIDAKWLPGVYDFNSTYDIRRNWHDSNGKLLFKGGAKKKFMTDVSVVLRNSGEDFDSLGGTVDLISKVSGEFKTLTSVPGSIASRANETGSEKSRLEDILHRASATISSAESAGMTLEELGKLREAMGTSMESVELYRAASSKWTAARDKLISVMRTDANIFSPAECREYCESVRPYLGGVFDWANWNYYAAKLTDEGLSSSCDSIRAGMEAKDVVNSTYRSLYKTMINICRQESEALRMFNATTFEGLIEKFKRLDATYTEINKGILKYRLYRNIPRNMDSSVPDSEAGKLYKAVSGTRMKKSIRTLLSEIPHMLPKLCPCLLMSPQSVAQYITMDYPKFDLVVFDESSQITTSKAIGSLGRAKAAIVAGDREQLPPTRFFQKTIEAEEGEEEIEDMESFLEDCLALNMPQTYLEWHYRSQHESLIAFSNKMFYDGNMLTFPSPNDQETRVGMRFVKDGVYEKGKRYNAIEAQAVVDEVYRRVMSRNYNGQSIGIIAFSISQQNCIEDAMDEMAAKNPKFYQRLNSMSEEMFIKNLETVQGDERDIILFSIGYGPGKDGTVAQSFGPINRAGGGRRLNVAVSRARYEMLVFSSMRYSDVKLTPTSSSGVRSMKEFLRFAENDGRFGETDRSRPSEGMSTIIEDIAASLKTIGYTSHFGIGNSGFKIDLAVVDPDDPEQYILGILNDGDSYKRSDNTRDREFARADVLLRLGWNIMHVWSVDWYFSKKLTLKKIADRIADIRAKRQAEKKDEIVEEDTEEVVVEETPKAEPVEVPEEAPETTISPAPEAPEETETIPEDVPEPVPEYVPEPVPEKTVEVVPEEPEDVPESEVPETVTEEIPEDVPEEEEGRYYVEPVVEPSRPDRDGDVITRKVPYNPPELQTFEILPDTAIFDKATVATIAERIIRAESPINEEQLLSLYRKSAGIKRLMEQKRSVLVGNLRETFKPEIRDEFVTYWAEGADRNVSTYRVSETAGGSRDITCVPLVEILNACIDVAETSVSIPKESCVMAVGKALGYKRVGNNVTAIVSKALEIAIADGLIKEQNGNIVTE